MQLYAVCSHGGALSPGFGLEFVTHAIYAPCVITGVLCHQDLVCNLLQLLGDRETTAPYVVFTVVK